MKEKYRIKEGSAAAVHCIKFGDYSGVDTIDAHNKKILSNVYKRVQLGLIDYAYIGSGGVNGGNLYIISRDTVYNSGLFGAVRVSCFWRRGSGSNAEFIASSHHTYNTLNDFLRNNNIPSGWLYIGHDWRNKLGVA